MNKPDKVKNATFLDGYLYIICNKEKEDYTELEHEMVCKVISIIPEITDFDDPWTLAMIAEKFPTVKIVIYDSWTHGDVYRYGNHKAGEWELVGETEGFV